MSDYTPTTEDVAEAWAARYDGEHASASGDERRGYEAEFNRWLAAHDAAKRVEWEAEQGETEWETVIRLRGQIEEARTAWWSATEQGDTGLIYTDRIEDAMDDIWSAIGRADWSPVPDTGAES